MQKHSNTATNLTHFTNFPAGMFLVGVRKCIYTALFLEVKELHFQSTWKGGVCIFEYISVRQFLFQWRRQILSDGEGGGGWCVCLWGGGGGGGGAGLNNFLIANHCLKCFKIVHFNFNFLKIQLFISISILPFAAFKRSNFPDNLDFKGKTVVKFLIRSHFLLI